MRFRKHLVYKHFSRHAILTILNHDLVGSLEHNSFHSLRHVCKNVLILLLPKDKPPLRSKE